MTAGHGGYEERLLVELRSLVAERQAPEPRLSHRRRRLLYVGGAAAAVAIAAGIGVPLLTGGGTATYAVTKNDDGSVTVEVSSLEDADGLQSKLRAAGVPAVVQYIPSGMGCKEQTFTPAPPSGEAHGRVGVQGDSTLGGKTHATFTIDRSMIQPDRTLVIRTSTGGGGPSSIMIAWAEGGVKPCELVDASQAAPQPLPGPPTPGGGPSFHTGP